MEIEAKEFHRINTEFNVIIEDIVINIDLPKESAENLPKINSMQKRKLPSEDDYDWNWAPYPRRIKSHRPDVSLYESNGYFSDELEGSQIVADLEDEEQDSACLSFGEDDDVGTFNSKPTDIRIITVDEVIKIDTLESPGFHHFHEEMCFDLGKLCEPIEDEEVNEKDQQKNAPERLLTITNDSVQSVLNENEQKTLKEDKQIVPYSPTFVINDTCEGEDLSDELQNDCQIEEFKFARCFKCRQKVYNMQNCPRHLTKLTTTTASKHVT